MNTKNETKPERQILPAERAGKRGEAVPARTGEGLGIQSWQAELCLESPVFKGLVKMENFAHSEQKIQYRYILTPDGIKEKIQVTAAFIERKQAEYERILQEIDEARQTFPS